MPSVEKCHNEGAASQTDARHLASRAPKKQIDGCRTSGDVRLAPGAIITPLAIGPNGRILPAEASATGQASFAPSYRFSRSYHIWGQTLNIYIPAPKLWVLKLDHTAYEFNIRIVVEFQGSSRPTSWRYHLSTC